MEDWNAYQKPQKEQVVMVRRGLSQIELFLLGKLRCHTMVKVIKYSNHGCWNKCSNDVENRDVDHVLSQQMLETNNMTIREIANNIYIP